MQGSQARGAGGVSTAGLVVRARHESQSSSAVLDEDFVYNLSFKRQGRELRRTTEFGVLEEVLRDLDSCLKGASFLMYELSLCSLQTCQVGSWMKLGRMFEFSAYHIACHILHIVMAPKTCTRV